MRKLLALFAATALLGAAGVAVADPDLTLTAMPHRHFIDTGSGLVEVGPRYCDDPGLLGAFTHFTRTHTPVWV